MCVVRSQNETKNETATVTSLLPPPLRVLSWMGEKNLHEDDDFFGGGEGEERGGGIKEASHVLTSPPSSHRSPTAVSLILKWLLLACIFFCVCGFVVCVLLRSTHTQVRWWLDMAGGNDKTLSFFLSPPPTEFGEEGEVKIWITVLDVQKKK